MTDLREKDIQDVCEKVIINFAIYYPNENSMAPSYHQCIFCREEGYEEEDIKHKQDCAYLIAKDLLTK